MSDTFCAIGICFVKLSASEQRFFGFAEFLASLALMVLVWTIAEPRYRFRVRTAPLPLYGIAYFVVGSVGFLTLLTDIWRAQEWYVPQGPFLTPATWQGLLGASVLLTFLSWCWYAFIRPPVFGRFNAQRFERAVLDSVLRGVSTELAVVADELADSMEPLLQWAANENELENQQKARTQSVCAYRIFLALGDPRFIRPLVASAPQTALALFRAMSTSRQYPTSLRTFARNFVQESIRNKESYLFHEDHGYETGFMGYAKPLTTTMFGRYELVEALEQMLDPHYEAVSKWDADQWGAYCRLTLLVVKAYAAQSQMGHHSYVLHRAFHMIGQSQASLYKLDGIDSLSDDNENAYDKLRIRVQLLTDSIDALNGVPIPKGTRRRLTQEAHRSSPYSLLADTAFEIIFGASYVRKPWWPCWQVQHNAVWSQLFHFDRLDHPVGKLVKQMIRRRIYDEISRMDQMPNYKGAALVAFTLNVLGHHPLARSHDRDSRPLKRVVVQWVKQHFHELHTTRPEIAAHCLVEGMTYDARLRRVLFSRRGKLGTKKLRYSYLQVK